MILPAEGAIIDENFLGLFLKVSICRNDIDFFARQGDLTQESFVDFKENQRCVAEKDTSFGVLHTFQKRPGLACLERYQ